MPNQEWLYKSSASILAATAATNDITPAEQTTANGYAWLVSKHKELLAMDESQARSAYDKLEPNIQESLEKIFGDTNYNPDEADTSLFGNAMKYVTNFGEAVLDGLGSYGEKISQWYRAAHLAVDEGYNIFDSRTWALAEDGNRLFDPSKEKEIIQAYTPEERLIAKNVSMGMGFGEILALMDSDAEFAAFERWAEGKDERINAAIRDYDQSKISWGRDFASLLGLTPEIGEIDQGFKGDLFKYVSGAADFAGDVAFDPITYIAAPIKALQTARFGVVSMLKAEQGSLSFAQKAFRTATLGKMKFGVDAAFESQGIRRTFDNVGALVKDMATKTMSTGEQAAKRIEIQNMVPQFDDNVIDQMVAAKVFDAESARQWFKNGDSVQSIMRGESGTMELVIPRATVMQEKRRQVAEAAKSIVFKTKLPEDEVVDDVVESLAKGQSMFESESYEKIKKFGQRHARMVERALVDRTVFVGGLDEAGRELASKSGQSIYTLARSFLPKYESRIISSMYVNAKSESVRRNLVVGLYKSMADAYGVDYKTHGKKAFETFMGPWLRATYGESVVIGESIRESGILTNVVGGRYRTGMVNGREMAVADNQLAVQAVLPSLEEFARLTSKKGYMRGISNTLNSEFMTRATDFWSAMNLLPRLGLRSVIDENAFHLLTAPIALLPNIIEGYRSSIITRVVRKSPVYTRFGQRKEVGGIVWQVPSYDQKDIGLFARLLRPAFVNKSDEALTIAQRSVQSEARFVEESLTQYGYGNMVLIKGNKERASWIGDHVRYGYARTTDDFSRGITQNQTVGIGSTRTNVFDGPEEMLNYNVPAIQKELGVEFSNIPTILYSGTPEFKINYLIQLNNRIDRNGEIGRLAVTYMEYPEDAVRNIAKYLRDNPAYFSRYERSAFQTPEQAAADMYMHVRSVLIKDDGELNEALLAKIKRPDPETGEIIVSAQDLTFADIEELGTDTPLEMFGYAPKTVQIRTFTDFISKILDRGFQVADRQIGTLSREPLFYAYLMKYRKDLKPLQESFRKKLVAGGMAEDVAAETANRRFAFLANDMSLNRMSGFIDNPNTRSVLALNARNVARYYRATEDFYRRAMRVVKNHPEALVRLRMTMEGLDHAGFIHEDDNGEKYFTFPVDEIMYNVYRPFLAMMTGEEPKQPMPLTLTGKVKMLAPSFDPEAALPTFSSPFMSASWTLVSKLIPVEYSQEVTRVLMGPYAEGRDLGEALTPSVIRKFMEFSTAALGHESEQIASATMKAAAYYTANGMGLDEKSTIAERELFTKNVQATARNIVAVRNLLGIFSPVTPGLMENEDIPTELLDQGVTSFRTEFQNLIEAEAKKGTADPYDAALRKWTKIHPGRLVYTVSESETDKVANVKKTKEAVDWMQANQALVDAHPEGSIFLTPLVEGFDISAYAYLKAEGFIKRKDLETYFEDIANIWAENRYEDIKQGWAAKIANEPTTSGRYSLKNSMQRDLDNFLADKEYLKLKFEGFTGNRQFKMNALNDTRALVNSGNIPADSLNTAAVIREMIFEYDKTENLLSSVEGLSDNELSYRDRVRALAAERIAGIAGVNQNAVMFYETVLKRLLEQ